MAENRKYYFLKLKEDFFEQDTIVLLESLKDGVLYSNILMKMYLKSLQFDGFLKINEHLSLTTEMIATLTRHEVGTVERALKIFLELGLAETTDTGTIYMSQIETLVGKSSTEGERKKLSRIRKEREKLDYSPPVLKVGRKVLIKSDILEKFMEVNEGKDLRDKNDVKTVTRKSVV